MKKVYVLYRNVWNEGVDGEDYDWHIIEGVYDTKEAAKKSALNKGPHLAVTAVCDTGEEEQFFLNMMTDEKPKGAFLCTYYSDKKRTPTETWREDWYVGEVNYYEGS